jgi:hypothetical protein
VAILDGRVFKAHGNEELSLMIEVSATNMVDPNRPTTVSAGVMDFRITDGENSFATGIDEMSITAAPSDIGYQDKFWVMAPCGSVPAHAGGGGNTENNTYFGINVGEDLNFSIEVAHADPDPDELTLNDGHPGPIVGWHGLENSSSDEEPVFRVGPADKVIDLPIGVKVMKNRTVKVAVWPMSQDSPAYNNSDAPIFDNVNDKEAFKEDLAEHLNRVFAFQLNAWFEIEIKPNVKGNYIEFSSQSDQKYIPKSGSGLESLLFSKQDSEHDINVYLVDDFPMWSGDPDINTARYLDGYSYVADEAPVSLENRAVVRAQINGGRQRPIEIIAHEIGHMLVGTGHPNKFEEGSPDQGGIAPLQTLEVEAHIKRLMITGDLLDPGSLLLVKTEWDEAEVWLSRYPDTR